MIAPGTKQERNRAAHLVALRSLCSLQPLYTVERSVQAIDALGAEESAAFLDAMRMRTLVARRLSAVDAPGPEVQGTLAALSAKVAQHGRMHQVLEDNLARLDKIAQDEGLQLFGGKGVSAHALYPDRSVRDFNDIDIFVRDRAVAARLAEVLMDQLGYRYQERELPWFKFDPEDGLLYGQIALVAPDGDDLLNVDLHFGDYSVRHSSRLSITGTLPDGSPGLHMIGAEENLACIVNNAAGDYFVTAKDTNDLLVAISQPDFRDGRLAAQLRGSRLDGFFRSIVDTLRASTVLTEAQSRVLDRLPQSRSLEPAPRPDRPDWNLRCLGTTLHAFVANRRAGVRAATRIAANAFSYYRKPLRTRVVPGRRLSAAERIPLNAWTCVRLLPLDMALGLLDGHPSGEAPARVPAVRSFVGTDTDVERFDVATGTFFRLGGEFFVATVTYDVSAEVIRQAAAAAGAAAGARG